MPGWQSIEGVVQRLVEVRAVYDDALKLIVESRNAGALPVLEILTREVEQLMQDVLAAFGSTPQLDA